MKSSVDPILIEVFPLYGAVVSIGSSRQQHIHGSVGCIWIRGTNFAKEK